VGVHPREDVTGRAENLERCCERPDHVGARGAAVQSPRMDLDLRQTKPDRLTGRAGWQLVGRRESRLPPSAGANVRGRPDHINEAPTMAGVGCWVVRVGLRPRAQRHPAGSELRISAPTWATGAAAKRRSDTHRQRDPVHASTCISRQCREWNPATISKPPKTFGTRRRLNVHAPDGAARLLRV